MKDPDRRNSLPNEVLLRARVVLPISSPPIANGGVLIRAGRIADIGPWKELRKACRLRRTLDLGPVALIPGLINAHCHLDYTQMAGHLPPPRIFTDWLKLITEIKSGWERADYAASWREGAAMLVQSGTTTVGDIEALPELLPDAWQSTPLRVLSFLELIGITSRRPPEQVVAEAKEHLLRLKKSRRQLGLSPHAPYSTVPALLTLACELSKRHRFPTCVHVAESALEYEMFANGSGAMFDWIQRSGRDMSDCGLGTPVEHLYRAGALHQGLLLAHANYLGRGDAALLGHKGVHVVHCPRSHFYFKHDPFPYKRLTRAGVNVCLGTDSLASVYRARGERVVLSMFAEMQAFRKAHPDAPPKTVLRMATVNGARALGLEGKAGIMARGAWADLIAVPFDGAHSVYEAVVEHRGSIAASMIGGAWAIAPQETTGGSRE